MFIKFVLVLRVRFFVLVGFCVVINCFVVLRVIDVEGNVIGIGVNYVLMFQYFENCDKVFYRIYVKEMKYINKDEENLIR